MYRPLPKSLTIKESDIEGLGLFATEDIPGGTSLGISHYLYKHVPIRTAIGSFYNHSSEPNCKKVGKLDMEGRESCIIYTLTSIQDIKKGEEITVCYTMYDPTQNDK